MKSLYEILYFNAKRTKPKTNIPVTNKLIISSEIGINKVENTKLSVGVNCWGNTWLPVNPLVPKRFAIKNITEKKIIEANVNCSALNFLKNEKLGLSPILFNPNESP